MSSEVICLSSDEDAYASIKNPNMTHEVEMNSHKRKLPFFQAPTDDDTKKQKIEKKESPQPECSKDLPQVPFNGNAATEKVAKLDLPQRESSKESDGIEKKVVKPQLVAKTKIPIPPENEDVFEKFVEMCLKNKDDADMRKILQKLKKSYNKLSPSKKTTNEFRLYISDCHNKIVEGLSNGIYKIIADLHTEIKKQIISVKESADNNGKIDEPVQVSKEDEKKIKLLENSIILCRKKIQELEDTDVDLNDDGEDSAYIMEDRYKKRLIQLCKELSKLNGDKDMRKQISKAKIKAKDIRDEMTGVKLFDEAILSLVNSNINEINRLKYLKNHESYAGHIRAPDYADVLNCIQRCNAANKLDLSDQKLQVLAKKAFEAVVKSLRKKRLDDTKFYIQSLVEDESEDPALKDENLKQKLQKSQQEGNQKLEEIFKKYAEKQECEKLDQIDIAKKSESGSEDDSDSDIENKNSDGNLASEEKSNEIDDKEKSDSSLLENNFIHNAEKKMETDNKPPSKDISETVEVIADKDNDTIVVLSDDNSSNDRGVTVQLDSDSDHHAIYAATNHTRKVLLKSSSIKTASDQSLRSRPSISKTP